MQEAGLIKYRRGTLQVLDRAGLEKASCECYAIVKERFDAFLTPPWTAVQGNTKGRTKLRSSVSGAASPSPRSCYSIRCRVAFSHSGT